MTEGRWTEAASVAPGDLPAARADDKRFITLAVLVSTFLVSLDVSVIATAMPTVIGQIGGIGLYSWVFSGYLLTSTVSVPLYGKLADLFGRKPMYLAACGIFLLASIACGQAQTMEQLILFRVLQGLGAGGVFPITQTIIGDIFPLEQRARLMGAFSSVWGISAQLGPAIGGLLTEQVGWRWVFYVNAPLVLLSMTLIGLFLRERVQRRAHVIDYRGALLLSGAVTLLLFGINPPEGVRVPAAALLLGAGALLALFLWHERRAPEPLVPLGLFRRRLIGVSALGSTLAGMIVFGQSTFVVPYVQAVMGAGPTLSGFVLAGTSLSWSGGATLSARMLLRRGYRATGMIGGGLLVIGTLLLTRLRPDHGLLNVALVQIVIGAGLGFTVPVLTVAAQNAVGWGQRGVVTSTIQFSRSIGGSLGVGVAGAVFTTSVAPALAGLGGVDANSLLTVSGRSSLSPAQLTLLQVALAGSLQTVFGLLVGVALAVLAVISLLPGGRAERHAWREPDRHQPDLSEPSARAADQPPLETDLRPPQLARRG